MPSLEWMECYILYLVWKTRTYGEDTIRLLNCHFVHIAQDWGLTQTMKNIKYLRCPEVTERWYWSHKILCTL